MLSILITVTILIFIVGFVGVAWLDGRGRLESDAFDALSVVAVIAVLWPALLGLALAVAPFAGLYFLIRKIASRSARR